MKEIYHSEKIDDTKRLAEETAEWITKQDPEQALVVALIGELGSGKTTFVQYLANFMGVQEKILSPTFVILKKFDLPEGNFDNFYHIDCYRIEENEELLKLDFGKIIEDPTNIVVIEWADKIEPILPTHYLKMEFKVVGEKERKIKSKVI
ncbi:MAG: tRNA (adenosine(37)-N6)-threonylcarbamoyltransferase complex ATPase subunit type 1 TsaE [Candidatus Paceibacterota bacterium]